MRDDIKSLGAGIVTLLTAAIAIWWLYVVYDRLGLKPEVDQAGNVVLDQYQRAKDILLVVLPLFTASLAYWTGSRGTTEAKQEAKEAQNQLSAVVDASSEGVLKRARDLHPEAFDESALG